MKSFVSVLIMLFMSAATVAAADPSVSINPDKSRVSVGETVSVDIVMQNFPTSEGGGVTLQFDPSVVKVIGVTINTGDWNFANSSGIIDNAGGKVSDICFSSFTGVAGDSTVATIDLEAIISGRSMLKLNESSLNPFVSGGDRLSVDFENGAIRVRRNKRGLQGLWKALFR